KALGSAILTAQARTRPVDGIRERERWAAIRGLLLGWSHRPEIADAWQLSGDPWRVLVGTTLTASSRGTRPTVTQVLRRFPTARTGPPPRNRRRGNTGQCRACCPRLRNLPTRGTALRDVPPTHVLPYSSEISELTVRTWSVADRPNPPCPTTPRQLNTIGGGL